MQYPDIIFIGCLISLSKIKIIYSILDSECKVTVITQWHIHFQIIFIHLYILRFHAPIRICGKSIELHDKTCWNCDIKYDWKNPTYRCVIWAFTFIIEIYGVPPLVKRCHIVKKPIEEWIIFLFNLFYLVYCFFWLLCTLCWHL